MPPNKMPMQIINTLFGRIIGTGPDRSMQTMKNRVPPCTMRLKFFFFSGMYFIKNEVIEYVIVSIEKMMPTAHTGRWS